MPDKRVTLRVSDEVLERLDALVEDGPYPNRSEVIRDGIRRVDEVVNRGS